VEKPYRPSRVLDYFFRDSMHIDESNSNVYSNAKTPATTGAHNLIQTLLDNCQSGEVFSGPESDRNAGKVVLDRRASWERSVKVSQIGVDI